jgi:peptidoglycan/xylan/chitin deacetylase (PgdA/CDA1 family)
MTLLPDIAAAIDRRVAQASRTKTVTARNRVPLVSITFDDFPASAARAGADILESRGVRGSYYVCGGLEAQSWDNGPQFNRADIERLAGRGHEIGCHTFEHLDCTTQSAAAVDVSLDRNEAYLRDVLSGSTPSTFSYPYGAYGTAAKHRLQRRFAACRGIVPGINAGTIDLGLLNAVAIPDRATGADWIKPWLVEVLRRVGWLILFTHDVGPTPGRYGCTPERLAATVDAILAAGIEILPLRTALDRVADGRARSAHVPSP